MASVDLDNLSKVYSTRRDPRILALDHVSLSVRSGEFFVLLGPSGSGKTTTLRLIAGLEAPSSGGIRIDGQPMADVAPDQRGVAMMFQDQPLFPHLNAGENLALPLRLRKRSEADIRREVADMAELLRLGDLLNRPALSLSGGEHRRVALGMALLKRPRVLLLDEPLVHLDPRLRADLRHELRQLQRRLGFTLLLVTHDHEEAMALGNRLAVMHHGALLQCGTPLEVYRRPSHIAVAESIGRHPVNWICGTWQSRDGQVVFATKDLPSWTVPKPTDIDANDSGLGRDVLLGLRPESLRLTSSGSSRPSDLPTRLEAVEPLGFESLLRCRVGTHLWTVRSESGLSAQPGGEGNLQFEPADVLWFDPTTSRHLARRGSD
jgi:multiple sugar transport system ATP-binding protein